MSSSATSNGDSQQYALTAAEKEKAIEEFCAFLKFETVSSTGPESGQYKACAEWLLSYVQKKLPMVKVWCLAEAPDNAPVVVAKWTGEDNDTLPILLLNSHYDVVPAAPEDWNPETPPFSATRVVGDDGIARIFARGTQDMKCVGIQYVEALHKIHQVKPDWKPARSIYLTFVPDEEIGGAGMAAFLDSELYQSTILGKNGGIGLALDEGLASTTETLSVFYGERLPWFVAVKAHGPTGHGSRFIPNTAVEQLVDLCNKALAFRTGQRELLHASPQHENCSHAVAAKKEKYPNGDTAMTNGDSNKKAKRTLGDVTSLNITSLEAGVRAGNKIAYNCVPPVAQCSLDIRISPHTDPLEIGNMLDMWCQECTIDKSAPMEWSYLGRGHDGKKHALTSTDGQQNKWYNVFAETLSNNGYQIEPQVFPAATDSRFLRALGIRAFGFSPMRSTKTVPCEILLHENNECIPEATFLEGIDIYIQLLRVLASQGKEIEE